MHVKKTETGPEAVLVGDPAGGPAHHYDGYVNYSSSDNAVHRRRKQRPLSSMSDSALSELRLKGKKMATEGQKRTRSRSRGMSVSPKWLAERSYSVIEDGASPENSSPSWHLQPTFPNISMEKNNRNHPNRLVKNDSWTESLLKKQSKIEKEYKGIRDFTRSKHNNSANNHIITYKPPKGYTNFVTGKPLMHQDRPPSGRERAHRRFIEKLEVQNRMLQDLSDSDDDDEDQKHRKGILKIPSCSDMDICLHGSCSGSGGGLSFQLAMDGLRIANDIDRSLSTQPFLENPSSNTTNDRNIKSDNTNGIGQKNNKSNENKTIGHSALVSTGSTSIKPGKKYKMNTRVPPEKTTEMSEGSYNTTKGSDYDYTDGADKLYEWSSLTATI